jgi:hypothetical protein
MDRLFFFIPFGYFLKTRLNTRSALLFHGYAEYLLGVLMLIYAGWEPMMAVVNFILAYLAFISVYEIGYIVNDFISVKFEHKPRKRLGDLELPTTTVYIGIAIRIIVFLVLTWWLHQLVSSLWWTYYLTLSFVFFLHNILKRKEYKIFTFISLAVLRFYAPIFLFLDTAFLVTTISGVLLFYVFFRTITYIDSKGLLMIPSRTSFGFKTNYYLILLPISFLISLLSNQFFTLWLNLYYLLFWGSLYLAGKSGFISGNDFKTES